MKSCTLVTETCHVTHTYWDKLDKNYVFPINYAYYVSSAKKLTNTFQQLSQEQKYKKSKTPTTGLEVTSCDRPVHITGYPSARLKNSKLFKIKIFFNLVCTNY